LGFRKRFRKDLTAESVATAGEGAGAGRVRSSARVEPPAVDARTKVNRAKVGRMGHASCVSRRGGSEIPFEILGQKRPRRILRENHP
jgi:hypothetical protein